MSVNIVSVNYVAASLHRQALVLEKRANRCRVVAGTIDTRRVVVVERHKPVMRLHNETVWQGHAAKVSRERLHGIISRSLYNLSSDLASASRALLHEADRLERQAVVLRRRAHQLEQQSVLAVGSG